KVYTENNTIVVSGLNKTAAVCVYDLTGRTIANQTTASSLRIPVQKGIYLVTVGEKRFKLVNQ
ncbi:MAG: T9SS type A sorting domain-containing protein, partial [Dysgonamonadaceae bacterium]|nr:T9SS type A sorting domain-containing protein [Dysgonamonadaceae bacterium]